MRNRGTTNTPGSFLSAGLPNIVGRDEVVGYVGTDIEDKKGPYTLHTIKINNGSPIVESQGQRMCVNDFAANNANVIYGRYNDVIPNSVNLYAAVYLGVHS